MELSRRQMLQVGGISAAALAGVTVPFSGTLAAKSASELDRKLLPRPYRTAFVRPPDLAPVDSGEDQYGKYVSYVINQRPGTATLLPSGRPTRIWGYQGQLPGPTIHVEKGHRAIVKVRNRLPEVHPAFGHRFATSTHLHGNASLPQYDGYANDLTPPGYSKVYQWPASYQPARTLWYHDHAAHVTSHNVYGGLVGQYHVHDAAERALLPTGEFDVPLTVSDVLFDEDGELGFDDRSHSGLWGDVVLVNGRPWPVLKVKRRIYRFRFLNASLARSYRPQLSPSAPMHMVATDGGLMPRSQQVTQWRVAPAERYEFLVDFRQFSPGTRVELRNLSNENNRDYRHTDKIMAFDVTDGPVDTSDPTWSTVPGTLVSHPIMDLRRGDAGKERSMRLKKDDVDIWTIDGKTWQDVIDSRYRDVFADPDLGDVEIWELDNRSGGWFHPIHVHLVDFQILERNGRPPFPYELGPKDTVYAGENEKIKILLKFGPHRGRYMIHCHNLPHEDHDMMTQFSVGLKDKDDPVNDPMTSAPAVFDTDGDTDVPPPTTPPFDSGPEEADNEPASSQPASNEPVSNEPVSNEPVKDEPVSQQPKTEQPEAEPSATESPKVEKSEADKPEADKPKTEKPTTEPAASASPAAEQSTTAAGVETGQPSPFPETEPAAECH